MAIIFCTKCSAPAYHIARKPHTQEGLENSTGIRNSDGSRKEVTEPYWCKIGSHEFKPLLSSVGGWRWAFQLRDYEKLER